jgi:hypothetical protein
MSSSQNARLDDVITQAELAIIAARQAALFEATSRLSEDLNRLRSRIAGGAVVQPGPYVFDSGRVLVRKTVTKVTYQWSSESAPPHPAQRYPEWVALLLKAHEAAKAFLTTLEMLLDQIIVQGHRSAVAARAVAEGADRDDFRTRTRTWLVLIWHPGTFI